MLRDKDKRRLSISIGSMGAKNCKKQLMALQKHYALLE